MYFPRRELRAAANAVRSDIMLREQLHIPELSAQLAQKLNDESLSTLMCEVKGITSSRPLTTVSDDPKDHNPITPNHFLLPKDNMLLPPGVFYQKDVYSRKRWQQIQYLADVFWSG